MRSNPAAENLVLAFFSSLLGKDTGSVIFFNFVFSHVPDSRI